MHRVYDMTKATSLPHLFPPSRTLGNINNHLEPTSLEKSKQTLIHPITPYAFDKKTPDLAQGLDFLRFWKGKPRKTNEKARKNLGTPGSKFLITIFII